MRHKVKTSKRFFLPFCILHSAFCIAAANAAAGPNLLKNGDFAANNGVDADGWEHYSHDTTNSVMRIVPVVGHPVIKQAVEMYFTDMDRVIQLRYKQPYDFKTNTVYEVRYFYQSEMDGTLRADTTLTGSGPMYRFFWNVPSKEWTEVRRIFATPNILDTSDGKIFLLQNRSMVPIRYANVSLRELDIPPSEVPRLEPSLSIHSITADDQLILPGGNKATADFEIDTNGDKSDSRFDAFYINGDKQVFPVAVSNLYCKIPQGAITDGKTKFYVRMKDGDVVINWASVEIEKIPEAAMPKGNLFPERPKCVPDTAGKPMMVIGMYCIDDDKRDWPMVELRNNGFNTLQSYISCGSWKYPEKMESLLERAHHNGMFYMVDIPHHWAEKPGNGANLEEWFKRFDKPPATLFFYTDEMYSIRKTSMGLFDVTRKAMKAATGDRRLWIAYEGPETFLASRLDGLLWNFSSPNMVKLARLRMGPDCILIHCFGQTHRFELETRVPPEEMRYNFFMPVILGARGVFYWTASNYQWRHKYRDELKALLFENARELSALSPLIISDEPLPADAPKVSVTASDGSVYSLVCAKGDEAVVLIGRDQKAVATAASYAVDAGGFSPQDGAKLSAGIAPGEIAIIRFNRAK